MLGNTFLKAFCLDGARCLRSSEKNSLSGDEEVVLEVEAVVELLVGGEEVFTGLVGASVGEWVV